MAGHDHEVDPAIAAWSAARECNEESAEALTTVFEEDLADEFPWASEDAIHNAAALISEHVSEFRDDPYFTMERLKRGIAVGRQVTSIVGRPVPLPARQSEAGAFRVNVATATTVWHDDIR